MSYLTDLRRVQGQDLFSKSRSSKSKGGQQNLVCILPSQLAISTTVTDGQIGHLDMHDRDHPQLLIPTEKGALRYVGKYIKSINKFFNIQLSSSRGKANCEVVDNFLVFDE
jgi:hypothetical protein